MIQRFAFSSILVLLALSVAASAQEENYPPHPDSIPQEGVPRGEVKGPFEWHSEIYPGTVRQFWIYVPAQYDPAKKACLFVVQDGLGLANNWKVPTVLDNLIHKGEIPVQIGVFIAPGVVPAPHDDAQPRFNRSFEYDSMGDRYARFLIEEILPEVRKSYPFSDDPNDRAIAGSSSGAICAFTAAWERPDQFRRVFSAIGTFVGLRGGNEYPILVRKFETKPIRVFLQDGSRDNNLYGGDWWISNQQMLSALKFSGYDVNHAWGEGGHNGKHAAAILPDALRWLWRDYPEPIAIGVPPQRRTELVIPGEDWQLVSEGHKFTEGPAVAENGEVYFSDIPNNRIYKVALDGTVWVFAKNTGGANGLMFGSDGKLYACAGSAKQIVRYDAAGNAETVLAGMTSNDIVILPTCGYFTDPPTKQIWRFTFDGQKQVVDSGIEFPNGIICSPDQTLLTVSDTRGQYMYNFQIQPDGTLAHKQQYAHLHLPDAAKESGADGLAVDTEGRIYATTHLGVQVLDQLGRVHLILNKPSSGWLSNVVFGGPEFDTLYVTCGGEVYKRKIKAQGVNPWQPAVKPPRPGL